MWQPVAGCHVFHIPIAPRTVPHLRTLLLSVGQSTSSDAPQVLALIDNSPHPLHLTMCLSVTGNATQPYSVPASVSNAFAIPLYTPSSHGETSTHGVPRQVFLPSTIENRYDIGMQTISRHPTLDQPDVHSSFMLTQVAESELYDNHLRMMQPVADNTAASTC